MGMAILLCVTRLDNSMKDTDYRSYLSYSKRLFFSCKLKKFFWFYKGSLKGSCCFHSALDTN